MWVVNVNGIEEMENQRRGIRKKKKGGGRMKRVVARDEGARHLWKALMRRYRPGRHCRLRKRSPFAEIIA